MTVQLPQSIVSWIRERISLLESEWPDPEVVRLAKRLGGLPLLLDMGGLYALRPSGEVVSIDWDGREEPTVEQDPRIIDLVLAQASRRYPELRPLLPQRSPDTPDCRHCDGTGVPTQFANNPALRESISCWCGGLGFIPTSWAEDCTPVKVELVEGDLLDQDVEVIVNPWNRNIIPWWLLLPQGVSGALKRRAGIAPFKEVRRQGAISLGGAVLTSAGRLPFKGIIHVAGINMLWRASERSIRNSVKNAVMLAHEKGFRTVAFPLIGAGSGGFDKEKAKVLMLDELNKLEVPMIVKVVVYKKPKR